MADQDFVARFDSFEAYVRKALGEANEDRTGGVGIIGEVLALKTQVGKVDPDGKDGSGMAGQLARTRIQVRNIVNLKHYGVGFVGALTVFAGLLVLGVQKWIGDFVATITGHS